MRKHNTMRYFLLPLTAWLWAVPLWVAASQIEDYKETVLRVTTGLEKGTAEPFNQALDVDAITAKATDDLMVDSSWKNDFRSGLSQGIRTSVGKRLLSQMAPGSRIKLLRLKQEDNTGRALLRFDFGDNGNSYIELFLNRSPAGKVRIVDWYDYGMGQRYTTSLQQLVAIMAPTPTVLGKLFDVVSERKETAVTLMELITLHKQQQYEALVRKFLAQDASFRRSRLLSLIAIHSANLSDDMELYRQALANLEQYHGDDEDLFLVLLDYYFLEQKYDKILTGLDKISALFGVNDAGLEVYRANACYYKGDYAGAVSAAKQAIAMEPEYEYGYWSQLLALTALGNYREGVNTARLLEERFGYDMSPESLGQQEELGPLLQSQAYRNWRARL